MLKIFGMEQCPHCRRCKGEFDAKEIEYQFIDISRLENLKVFLKLRDTNPEFDGIRGTGQVGIPALVLEDGTVRRDWQAYLEENYDLKQDDSAAGFEEGQACSLDGKGC
ncbi:MAG: glutaredoxin domain-containing protein [Pseudoramibacter sp.]